LAENRNQPRHRKRIQVKYGVEAPSRVGFTEDISDEGFFIKSAIVLRPGTILQVELRTPDGEVISIEGRIRWAKKVPPNLLHRVKGGMGIKIRRFNSGQDAYRRFCVELHKRYA